MLIPLQNDINSSILSFLPTGNGNLRAHPGEPQMPPGWTEVARNAEEAVSHYLSPACVRAVPAPFLHSGLCLTPLLQCGIHPFAAMSAAAGCRREWQRWLSYFFNLFFLKGLYNLGDSINKNNGFELWEQPAPAMSREMLQVQNTAVGHIRDRHSGQE